MRILFTNTLYDIFEITKEDDDVCFDVFSLTRRTKARKITSLIRQYNISLRTFRSIGFGWTFAGESKYAPATNTTLNTPGPTNIRRCTPGYIIIYFIITLYLHSREQQSIVFRTHLPLRHRGRTDTVNILHCTNSIICVYV